MRNIKVFFAVLLIALAGSCGQQTTSTSTQTVVFTVSPLNTGDYKAVGPMGSLNPRMGHAFPTEHGGFSFSQNTAGLYYNVYAPADGTIIEITYTESEWPAGSGQAGTYTDWQVDIQHSDNVKSRFGHMSSIEAAILAQAGTLQPDAQNSVSIPVVVGQTVGFCGGRPGAVEGMDWFVIDYAAPAKSFINLSRYSRIRYSMHFLDYCTSELKNLYAPLIYNPDADPIVTREAAPLGGKIDFDQAGKLSGNWFHNSIATVEAAIAEYNKQLAFVYDEYDPALLRVSFGGPEGEVGNSEVSTPLDLYVTTYQVVGNSPDPAAVNIASGEVVYQLKGLEINNETTFEATLLIELISNEAVRVEGFSGHINNPSFTSNAETYIR